MAAEDNDDAIVRNENMNFTAGVSPSSVAAFHVIVSFLDWTWFRNGRGSMGFRLCTVVVWLPCLWPGVGASGAAVSVKHGAGLGSGTAMHAKLVCTCLSCSAAPHTKRALPQNG